MKDFFKSAGGALAAATFVGTAFCLLGASLLALFVRAYAPDGVVICICNQAIKCVCAFAAAFLLCHGERTFFKGGAAGILICVFTMLVFGWIGGFRLSAFFLLELILCALFGAFGGICRKKLRKD